MQQEKEREKRLREAETALNSLCGISSNATSGEFLESLLGEEVTLLSQFPLWDFFECNSLDGTNGSGVYF